MYWMLWRFCWKLTINTPEKHHLTSFDVFIVNFKHIQDIFQDINLVFLF